MPAGARLHRCLALGCLAVAGIALAGVTSANPPSQLQTSQPGNGRAPASGSSCPSEMVQVRHFCIDRWEISTVDAKTGAALSPFYPPDPRQLSRVFRIWQVEGPLVGDVSSRALPLPEVPPVQRGDFSPRAVSKPGVIPQGYMSYVTARRACANASKRLCTEDEWVTACKGRRQLTFPYGATFDRTACNIWRHYHPAFVLHKNSSIGHGDPRLNLVVERGVDPLLRVTGGSPRCASEWGAEQKLHDMVGNLDEWIEDPKGVFVGGFYARATSQGCDAKIESHSPIYFDYSTGTRCCRSLAVSD